MLGGWGWIWGGRGWGWEWGGDGEILYTVHMLWTKIANGIAVTDLPLPNVRVVN